MIDEKYQGQGYRTASIKKVIELCQNNILGDAQYIWLSYEPENQYAKKLYNKLVFVENGEK